MKLSDKKKATTQTVVIYGPPKCGKSETVGRLASHFKLLWFDLENGWVVLSKLPQALQDNIELISIPDTRSFPVAIGTMMKVLQGKPVNICEEHGVVGCSLCIKAGKPSTKVELNALTNDWIVVIDSGTQLTNSAIAHITKDKEVDYKLQTDDWGNLGKYMDFCLSHIQNASYNVVFITHETDLNTDEKAPERLVPVAGTRNFSRNMAKYFGHVVHMEVKNRKHIAASSTTYATNMLTGSRTDVELEKDPEINLLRIFKPELFPNEEPIKTNVNDTPAATAVSRLQALKSSMGAKA